MTRRELLKLGLAAGVHLTLPGCAARAGTRELLTKGIPSTGEQIPVIGIGTANDHFTLDLPPEEVAERKRVFEQFTGAGGQVLDVYLGESTEAMCGNLIRELGTRERFFIATKVRADDADPSGAAIARMNASFRRFDTDVIDLMQVPNLTHWQAVLPILREWKQDGRFRYIGVTVFQPELHEALEAVVREQDLDFVQLDYSLEGRQAEDRLLPLAADRGMAVIANVPFRRGIVFQRLGDRELPGWADDLGCQSMAQVALKFIVSHPSVTCAIPGTYKTDYLHDNLGAALGPMPDAAMRRTMASWYDALPVA